VEKYDKPRQATGENIIRRLKDARIQALTNSEYVTLIAFPL
jgi:hypothetical protein